MTRQHQSDEQQDALDFERVAEALTGAFDEVPEADRTALWNVVESRMGPQHVPWHVALRNSVGSFAGSLQGPARQMAIAGAAVAVVGALFLSGVFENGNRASAAVLEQVNELSVATEAALADGVLSAEEIADLHERALALLAEIESDPEALNVLTPADLKLVISLLSIVGDDLDDHVDDDHGDLDEDFDEVVESIFATTGRAEEFRTERGDDDDDGAGGDDGDEQPGVLGTAETSATAEADETPEATATSEATSTPEADEDGEDGDHEDGEDGEDSEADGAPEADGTPESDGTPEGDETSSTVETSERIAADEGTYSFAAGSSGSVTFSFDGEEFEVVSVSEAVGWESEVSKPDGEEIAVGFRAGSQEMSFEVKLDDGEIRIRTKLESIESSDDD